MVIVQNKTKQQLQIFRTKFITITQLGHVFIGDFSYQAHSER